MNLTKLLLLEFAAAALLLTTALGVSAQSTYTGPTAERTRDESERDLEDRIAYQRMRAALEAKRVESRRDPTLAFAELQDDFTHLQIINKELVLGTNGSAAMDFNFVARSATEIHKRAERLMSNLALPDPEDLPRRPKPAEISDSKQLKSSITALGWLIYRFTKNPIFKEANVIETQPAAKARRDLEEIIEISEQIRKSSEQLNK